MVNLEKVGLDTWALCKKDKNESSVYLVNDLALTGEKVDSGTTINVHNQDYISLAYDMAGKYKNVAMLNMASEMKAGGGFLKGATAGEEELCRRSSLYPQLLHHQSEYPFRTRKLIYSRNVSIIKAEKTYKRLKEERNVDVISVPALRHPKLTSTGKYKRSEDYMDMCERIDAILMAAKLHNIDCLVLSAFGSGCFGNPSEQVAKMFRDRLGYFDFQEVVFGIIDNCLRGRETSNFVTYQDVFDVSN